MGDRPRAVDALDEAAAAVSARWPNRPLVGLVLGSGLGDLADEVGQACTIPFADIPHHPRPTVPGHRGEVVLGLLEGVHVAVWRGRVHFYEGRSMAEVAFPMRLVQRLGARAAILTNAAGGLNEAFQAGDLMLLTDHLNLPGLIGHNPLRGEHDPSFGERFVDLSQAYDRELRKLALDVAERAGFALRRGVYAMVSGPHYETPAEGRLLRQLGADAVGMSTVPEVIVARQAGLRVLAISAITNQVLTPAAGGTSHAEVLAMADRLRPRFGALVHGILAGLGEVLEQ